MGYANSDYYFNDYKIYAYSKATKTRTKKATKTRTKKATKNRTEKATKTRTKKQRLRLAPKKKYSANFLREVNHKYLQHKTKQRQLTLCLDANAIFRLFAETSMIDTVKTP